MGSDVNQGLGPHWLMSRDVDEPCGQKGGILSESHHWAQISLRLLY